MNYQAMIQSAVELKRGAAAGCALTVTHNGSDGSQFVSWCIGSDGTMVQHALDAANTTQERLNAHWMGFVANREALIAA